MESDETSSGKPIICSVVWVLARRGTVRAENGSTDASICSIKGDFSLDIVSDDTQGFQYVTDIRLQYVSTNACPHGIAYGYSSKAGV